MSAASPEATGSRRSSARVKALAKPPAPATPAPATTPSANSASRKPNAVPSARSLRPRRSSAGIYEISSDSEERSSGSEHQASNSEEDEDEDDSQLKLEQEDEDEEDEEGEAEVERPERGTEAGRSLRPRTSLATPEGLRDYVDINAALSNRKQTTKKKKKKKTEVRKRVSGRLPPGRACQACRDARRRCDRQKPRCSGCVKTNKPCVVPDAVPGEEDNEGDYAYEEIEDPKETTVRTEIRKTLEETKKKRDAFLIHYRKLFEGLLPEKNYITKLLEKQHSSAVAKALENGTYDVPMSDAEFKEEHPDVKTEFAVKKENPDVKSEDANGVSETATMLEVRPDVKPEVKAEVRDIIPYKLLHRQPEHVMATMKPHQLSGLSFLLWLYDNGSAGILGDEMGLGKTLQTLSLFSYLSTYRPVPEGHQRPFLVVCPLSVLSSWMAESKKWVPHLRALRFHGPTSERARLKKVAETGEAFGMEDDSASDGRGYDIVVTSYEVFEREKAWFRRAFVWRYVVLDEGHKIKNEKTNIATALQGLSAEYRLILTGTPLQNNLAELWALLHWLFPEVFQKNTVKLFSDAFDLTLGKNNLNVMDRCRDLLELVMLRRMKESKGVDLGLPPKTEVVMFLPLVPMQRFWYKRLLTRLDKGMLESVFADSKTKIVDDETEEVGKVVAGHEHVVQDDELVNIADDQWGETKQLVEQAVQDSKTDGKWRKLMNLLMQLRKCCDHPFLLPNAEPDNDEMDHSSMIILASSKMIFLDKLIEELCIRQGRKVLIFSGFTKMLDLCEDFMQLKGGDGTRFKYGRLDGTTPRARRNLNIRLFNNDSTYKIMLISTRAGGLGINLASASDVVMLESDWNPQADLQAQARAHRIGQTKPVTIYRLVTQGTVEEQMMGRIRKKLYLSAKVTETMRDIHTDTSSAGLNAGDAEDSTPSLSTGQLMSLVRSGARAIARPEIDPAEMLNWDWATTVQKCRDYQDQLENEEKTDAAAASEEEKRWLSEMERVESRVFEGKRHENARGVESNRDIAADWSREARRAGMERVVMINGIPVLKETIGNNEWEAVKTMAGKDPRLAEPPKRKRKAIEHQDYCQVCFDGGTLHTCSGCPRSYHDSCLPTEYKPRIRSKVGNFYCPQHECAECEQKTVNAGGLIFRCRWCENGFCEDCMDWDKVELLGESLVEFELLGFGSIEQAFWIKCERCIERHEVDRDARIMCEQMEREWNEEKEKRDAGLTMDGTTVEGSEVATPAEEPVVHVKQKAKPRKRKSMASTPVGVPLIKKKAKMATPKSKSTPVITLD